MEFVDDFSDICDDGSMEMDDDFQCVSKDLFLGDDVSSYDIGTSFFPEEMSETFLCNSFDDIYNEEHEFEDVNSFTDIEERVTGNADISFGSNYSEEEIQKLKSDVEKAEYERKCCEDKVREWESKVSLNNTTEKKMNGDYDNAMRYLNEAKYRYNNAVSHYNDVLSKYNNAR